MVTANRLELGALKSLVLRHLKAAATKGLYIMHSQLLPPAIAKMPPGLMRLRKEHEMNAEAKLKIFNINFVFERTIPRLAEKGVFEGMTEAESDTVIGKIIEFASISVKRAEEIRSARVEYREYYGSIWEFFSEELVKYSDWIKRNKEIEEIIAFKAGIRSEDEQARLDAIKRAGELGMVEAAEDLLHIIRSGSSREKLEVIEVMQRLGQTDLLKDELNYMFGNKAMIGRPAVTDLKAQFPAEYQHESPAALAADQKGNIHIFGGSGMEPEKTGLHKNMWSYDPKAAKWTDLTALVPGKLSLMANHEVILGMDGKIYLFGGAYDDAGKMKTTEFLKGFWAYDPETGKWDDLSAKVPAEVCPGIFYSAAAGNDGNIYLSEGYGKTEEIQDLWSYDPKCDRWTNITSQLPGALLSPRSRRIITAGGDGNIYIFRMSITLKRETGFWSYDPKAGKWTDLSTQLPAELVQTDVCPDGMVGDQDGNIYLFSKEKEGHLKEYDMYHKVILWSYDPRKGAWTDISTQLQIEITGRAIDGITADKEGNIYLLTKDTKSKEFWKIAVSMDAEIIKKVKNMLQEQINANG